MRRLKDTIAEYAENSEYREQAEKFLTLNRWTRDAPVLLLADAAGTTTGQTYFDHVKPSVEAFRDEFLRTGRIDSFGSLSKLDPEDQDLKNLFEASRKRHVLITGADALSKFDGETDLDRLQTWAEAADPYRYTADPVGSISGVGLRTFQYLRMIAGIDTVKPDIQVARFIELLADETGETHLDSSSDHAVLESCEWIASRTEYRLIELDQIAWWTFSDAGERHAER